MRGYQLPGYERALEEVIRQALALIRTGHVFFADSQPRYLARDRTVAQTQLVNSTELSLWSRQDFHLDLQFKDCVEGNYGAIVDQLAKQVTAATVDWERQFLKAMGEACDAAGQAGTTSSQSPLDQFLDALEMTLIQFSSSGEPDFSRCRIVRESANGVASCEYAVILRELEVNGSSDQRERYRAIVDRQREEWSSGKRSF